MNDYMRVILNYIVNGDYQKARDTTEAYLRQNKIARDQDFCDRMLEKLNAYGKLEIPYNLRDIIQTSCTPYPFEPERYFMSEREKVALEHVKKMQRAGQYMANRGLRYANTILLYGESGTGKTTFAQYIAKTLNLPFLYISITQLIDSYLGETVQNLALVFNFITNINGGAVVVLDELDSIGGKRLEGGAVSSEMKRILIAMLENIDRINNSIILVGATNRPQVLDDALLRRFTMKHEVSRLNEEEAVQLIHQHLKNADMTWSDLELSCEPLEWLRTSVDQNQTDNSNPSYVAAIIIDRLNEQIAATLLKNMA